MCQGMSTMVSHAKGGGTGDRAAIPEKLPLGGGRNHGATIDMGAISGEPGRISLVQMLVGGHAITISKQSHMDQGICKGARDTGRRVDTKGGETGQLARSEQWGVREGLSKEVVRIIVRDMLKQEEQRLRGGARRDKASSNR